MVRRHLLKVAWIVAAILGMWLALSQCGGSDNSGTSDQGSNSSFLFAVISDTHIWWDARALQDQIFAYTVQVLNEHNPPIDFVVLTGDILHKLPSDDPEFYDENSNTTLGEFLRLSADLKMPLHLVMGNHDYYTGQRINDVITSDRKGREKLFMDKAGMPGPYYAFEHGGVKFYCLNSLQQDPAVTWVPDTVGSFGPEQISWLRDQLSDGKPAFFFHHHPLATQATTSHGASSYKPFEIPRADGNFRKYRHTVYSNYTDPIYDVIKTHTTQIKAVFFGHAHLFLHDVYEGIPLYMTDSMEFPSLSAYEGEPMRYYIVECQPNTGDFTILNEYMIRYAYTSGDKTADESEASELDAQTDTAY